MIKFRQVYLARHYYIIAKFSCQEVLEIFDRFLKLQVSNISPYHLLSQAVDFVTRNFCNIIYSQILIYRWFYYKLKSTLMQSILRGAKDNSTY